MAVGDREYRIKVKSNAVDFAKRLTNFGNEFNRAVWYATVQTTEKVRRDLYAEMRRVFDSPTKFTLNSLETVKSIKTDEKHFGIVRTKLGFGSVPAGRYLSPQIEGGDRRKKSLELRVGQFAVPTKFADLDVHGNIAAGVSQKIISQLGRSFDPANNASNSTRSRGKRKGRAFFKRGNVIYERALTIRGVIPIFVLLDRSPKYRKRFDFDGVAEEVATRVWPIEFEKEIDEKLRRLGF